MIPADQHDKISYKRANSSELQQMMHVFAEAFGDQDSYLGNPPTDAYIAELIGRTDFIPIAAISENRVVGALAAYLLRKFEQERSEIYIYDLAVDDAFRRRGIATGMINFLRSIARERGDVWVIYVQADPPDEPAVRLYDSLGVRENVLHFDIEP